MKFARRDFLKKAGLATTMGMFHGIVSCKDNSAPQKASMYNGPEASAEDIRANFELDPEYIHMAGMLLASHPKSVKKSIEKYREALNRNPAKYILENKDSLFTLVSESAAKYMEVKPEEIALTDSTTMGTALLINGLHIRTDQEMLTADYDYYSTHRSIDFKVRSSGASSREIAIYGDIHKVSEEEIIDKVIREIKPSTRLVTGTWVHSATGLKIPVKKIAEHIAAINANRSNEDRVLFFVDGVHGFGVENQSVGDLGCDFFSAGTHKWMYGPRGTGVLWGNSRVHGEVSPTIPTFTYGTGWGGEMTPGGYKPFEHQWTVANAFHFHMKMGKEYVQDHIHSLARQLKESLAKMSHITLLTPMEENLSSGIVCFSVNGMTPEAVVNKLTEKKIIASKTPYRPSYPRLSPGIYNTSDEMEKVLRAIRTLG